MKLPSKELLEQLKEIISIGRTTVVVIGVLVLFFYCISERVMPDGLSLGDALLLILIALGFGIIVLVGTLYGAITTLWFVQLLVSGVNRLKPAAPPTTLRPALRGFQIVSVLCCVIFVIAGFASYSVGGSIGWQVLRTILFFPLVGFVLLLVFGVTNPASKLPGLRWSLGFAVLIFLSGMIATKPALLDLTMITMGIRSSPGALIVVSDSDHERLDELARQSGLTLEFCQLPRSSQWGTRDARAIWHGIGSTSWIKLLDRDTDGKDSLLVPIPRTSLEVIRPENVSLTCKGTLGYRPAPR